MFVSPPILEIAPTNNPMRTNGTKAPILKTNNVKKKNSEKRKDAIEAKIGAIQGSRK